MAGSTAENPTYRLLAALVLSVTFMLLDHRTEVGAWLRHGLDVPVAVVHSIAQWPVNVAGGVGDGLQSRSSLQDSHRRLTRQNLILRQKVQRLAVLEAENVRLRELLGSSANLDAGVFVTEIVGVSADPNRQELWIRSPSEAPAFPGQAVLDAEGIIGQVVNAGVINARVLLITDASHAMSVQVNRNGVRAVLAGSGAVDELRLLYVPVTADIQEGDLLVSTGLGARYPRGYPVAKVTSVTLLPGAAFAEIIATPAARIDRASHVLLVKTPVANQERPGNE